MSTKKPFLAINTEIDDEALERVARAKGVPALTPAAVDEPARKAAIPRPVAADRAGEGAIEVAKSVAPAGPASAPPPDPAAPTPRARISYVKAGIPDYALIEMKTRAMAEKVSLNHLILSALKDAGISIKPADLIEDGRRLRGKNSLGA